MSELIEICPECSGTEITDKTGIIIQDREILIQHCTNCEYGLEGESTPFIELLEKEAVMYIRKYRKYVEWYENMFQGIEFPPLSFKEFLPSARLKWQMDLMNYQKQNKKGGFFL